MQRYKPVIKRGWEACDDEAEMEADPNGEYVKYSDIPQWISVQTALPEKEDEYLIWPHVELGQWHISAGYDPYKKEWWINFDIGGGYQDTYHPKPTHWQKRPTSPEE